MSYSKRLLVGGDPVELCSFWLQGLGRRCHLFAVELWEYDGVRISSRCRDHFMFRDSVKPRLLKA